jgi:hypothetical protein
MDIAPVQMSDLAGAIAAKTGNRAVVPVIRMSSEEWSTEERGVSSSWLQDCPGWYNQEGKHRRAL